MHHKNIKLLVRKQLKTQYPNWNRLNRKIKKEISRKVLAEITTEYNSSGDIPASPSELLGIEQQVSAMRNIFPGNLFRAELLKEIKYPEISYRKFCTEEYLCLDRKQNRVFCGLSLSRKEMIDHTQILYTRVGPN